VSLDAEGFFCPVLTIGALAGLGWLVVRMSKDVRTQDAVEGLDLRVRELSARVRLLERGAPSRVATTDAVESSAEPPAAPAPHAPATPEPRDEPPPLSAVSAPPPAAPSAPPQPAERPSPEISPRPEESLETFLGGRVMLVTGVIVVLFGIAFFLKFAIDREWIGPGARVALGAAAGIAMLFAGGRLREREFDVFGQALMGCGLGAVYLSNFYACAEYQLVPRPAGFAVAAVVTALGAALALRRNAPILLYLGFLGGYLAPALLGDRHGTFPALTGWLLFLDAGVLAAAVRRAWRGLDGVGLVFTVAYAAEWISRHGSEPATRSAASACVGALVLMSLAKSVAPALVRRERPQGLSLLAVAGASVLGGVAWHVLLAPVDVAQVGAMMLALGVALAAAGWRFERRVPGARVAGQSLYGLAAAALVAAVLEMASGDMVAPALSAVGLALVFAGARGRHGVLAAAGLCGIGIAFADLVSQRTPLFDQTMAPVFNRRLLLFETPCVALVAASLLLKRSKLATGVLPEFVGAAGYSIFAVVLGGCARADLRFGGASRPVIDTIPVVVVAAYALCVARFAMRDTAVGRVLALGPLALAFVASAVVLVFRAELVSVPFLDVWFAAAVAPSVAALAVAWRPGAALRRTLLVVAFAWIFTVVTTDLYAWGEHGTFGDLSRDEVSFRAQVAVSVAWALYAAALVAAGFCRAAPALRWTGLAVFALTLAKVFLVDMAQLEAVYRIGSFLVLGALLVGASFLYQRARRVTPPPAGPGTTATG
jgi:uncharacterized membrane protein